MVAPAAGSFSEPPCPLPPDLRSDIAYRRARGDVWEAIGVVFHYHSDALRRATENDPEFAAAAKRARREAWHESQAEGMSQLRLQAKSSDAEKAFKASKVLIEYAAERQANETRLKIERIRAKTRLAVEELRAAGRAERRAAEGEAEVVWQMPIQPAPETEEERQKRFAREHAERAAQPTAEVYIWGGKHSLGRCVGPDESDTRVRVRADWSCGLSDRGIVYWVVPDPPPPEAWMPGDPNRPAQTAL